MSGSAPDPAALRAGQYRTQANLQARIGLHARFSTNPLGWYRWVFDQLELPAAARVLELGCGTGALWTHNAARMPAGWWVVLTDASLGMLASAAMQAGVAARLVADAQAIPFAAASVDAVIANHVLYHVPDREGALREIRRVLRPGGQLYAASNGPAHLRELRELLGVRLGQDAEAFGLETGPAQVARWFADVRVRRYEDALEVTELAPLLAYARSVVGLVPTATAETVRLDALAAAAGGSIHANGRFRITKDAGLILARR